MTQWKFGGTDEGDTDLATFGKVTLIDDYLDMADSRGSNIEIPFRHGSVHTQKYFSERVMTFGIVVIGDDAADLESQLDDMRQLFAPRIQQALSNIREDTSTRNAVACVEKSMNVKRLSDRLARVTVEFTLAEPFFRAASEIADNTTTIDASPKAMEFDNPGTVDERNPTIVLTGPLENTVITNSTNGCVLTYTGVIASPRVVTIETNETGEYIATDDLGTNVIGNVSHSGAPALMVVEVGTNTFSIADDEATTGTVQITFKAPYM